VLRHWLLPTAAVILSRDVVAATKINLVDDSRKTLYWGIATLTGSIFLAFALSPVYLRATMMPFVGMPALLLLLGISLAGMCRVSYLFYTAKRSQA
jgi:VIT1/CCC1 family predicted Fe2+/Mn2+ transporter